MFTVNKELVYFFLRVLSVFHKAFIMLKWITEALIHLNQILGFNVFNFISYSFLISLSSTVSILK